MKYFAIHDIKAERYLVPVIFDNEAVAIRWFTAVINDKEQKTISDFPEDYTLEYIGKFDERTGIFTTEKKPKLVMTGKTVSRKEQ